MDINTLIESGELERYAKNELDEANTSKIDKLLAEDERLGEELENIYIRLESSGDDQL